MGYVPIRTNPQRRKQYNEERRAAPLTRIRFVPSTLPEDQPIRSSDPVTQNKASQAIDYFTHLISNEQEANSTPVKAKGRKKTKRTFPQHDDDREITDYVMSLIETGPEEDITEEEIPVTICHLWQKDYRPSPVIPI